MNPTVDDVLCGPWSTLLHLKVSLDWRHIHMYLLKRLHYCLIYWV